MDGGGVEVSHGKIIEGGRVKVLCPTGSAGQGVYLACEGGFINITESTCVRSSYCKSGSVSSDDATVYHDNLDDGEDIVLPCPEGFTGSLQLKCSKAKISTKGRCNKGCAAGLAKVNELSIPHGVLQHGGEVELDCFSAQSHSFPSFLKSFLSKKNK